MKSYTRLTEKYLLGQKKRSLLTIFGIVLSVTLLTSIGTIGMSYRDKLIRQTIQEYGDYNVSFNNIPGEAVSKVVNHAAVDSAGIVSREGYAIISETSEKEKRENPFAAPYRYLNVKGYDAEAMNKLQIQLDAGRLPENSNEIILSTGSPNYFPSKPKLGDHIKLDLGYRVVASTGEAKNIYGTGDYGWSLDEDFRAQTEREFTVVGLMKPGRFSTWSSAFILPGITYNDYKTIDQDHKYFIYLNMKSLNQIKEKTESIVASLQLNDVDQGSALMLNRDNSIKNVRVEYNNELLKLYGKSTYEGVNNSLMLSFAAVILIIILCTSAVIYNAFHISVLERMTQFGILRCVGATPRQIRKIVVKEAALLSLIGIPIGIVAGTVFMKILFYNISFLALGFLNDMKMVVSWPILTIAGLLGFVTVYLSAIGPARQAAKASPLEAVRGSGSTQVDKVAKVKPSRFAKKLFGIEGQFAGRNLRRNKKRFRITAFSMVISIVLFIVFSGVVDLLMQQSTKSGIDYSYSIDYNGLSNRIDDHVYADIAKLDAVQHAYKFYNNQIMAIIPKNKIDSKYYELKKGMYVVEKGEGYRTDNNYLQSFGDNGLDALQSQLKAGTIDKEKMNQENGVIVVQKISVITEQGKQMIMDQTHFKVGDQIQIRAMDGSDEYKTVTVMGIADQSFLSRGYNESAILQFLTTPTVFANITGSDTYSRIFILANSDLSHKPIVDYLQALIQKDAGYSYYDKVAEQAKAQNDATTASIFFYGFIGIIVFIAFLNILNTVSTNLILRTKEFAVLKAIGMTQKEISKMILLEGVFYGLYAAVYGIIIGIALSYGIHRFFSGAVDIAWMIPWQSIGIAFIGAIITTLIATAWPMHRLNKISIVDALRKED